MFLTTKNLNKIAKKSPKIGDFFSWYVSLTLFSASYIIGIPDI